LEHPGYGCIGVEINVGTLQTSGAIAGTNGYTRSGGSGLADAVYFGAKAGTLIIDPGATFTGNVVANANVHDTLVLSGTGSTSAGTLTGGLGVQFTGFTNVTVDKGAGWTITGANILGSLTTLKDSGTLLVTGSLADAGRVSVAAGAIFGITGAGTVQADKLDLAGGTLAGEATGAIAIGATAGADGTVTIDAGSGIHGFGTIAGAAIVDNGAIVAQSGTLTLAATVTGLQTASIAIEAGAALVAQAGVSGVVLSFGGPASLILADPLAVTSAIAGFGTGDVIDLKGLKANTLTYAGGTLTLEQNGATVDTLVFQGSYTAADFALKPDGHGGTDISFAGTANDLIHAADFASVGGYWHALEDMPHAFPWALPQHG
jgi:hypothetical protein